MKAILRRVAFRSNKKIESHLIVNLFLDAVKREGLLVFEQKITHDMIKPVQVAWVYETENDQITISIFSKLIKPLTIPHYEKFYIDGISVNVSEKGEVIEVKAHVLPE